MTTLRAVQRWAGPTNGGDHLFDFGELAAGIRWSLTYYVEMLDRTVVRNYAAVIRHTG